MSEVNVDNLLIAESQWQVNGESLILYTFKYNEQGNWIKVIGCYLPNSSTVKLTYFSLLNFRKLKMTSTSEREKKKKPVLNQKKMGIHLLAVLIGNLSEYLLKELLIN
jgi:hypothetical protein